MQTLEQSLAELVLRGTIDQEVAVSRSSKPEQLLGLIRRTGTDAPPQQPVAASGLRVAGS
jgi:hypothetical protein